MVKFKYDADIDGDAWDLGWEDAVADRPKKERPMFEDPEDWELYIDGYKAALLR